MKASKHTSLSLPGLRGIMGDWVYYSCLMGLDEVAKRVSYATDVHKNMQLSDMIQRTIKIQRSSQIAKYLKNQPERFFNSLVVATYGGNPNWLALSDVRKSTGNATLGLDENTVASVGFLTFEGSEKLFALDGQHRLSGIKRAVKEKFVKAPFDELSVIFVAHKRDEKGLERTRRLFTTLNKTAKAVSKGELIALDEDDPMAITVRRLIEDTSEFGGKNIAFVANNNMPLGNNDSLTTIGNLYDILSLLFSSPSVSGELARLKSERHRPSDEELDKLFELAKSYFSELGKSFSELGAFFKTKDRQSLVVKKFRGSHGGSILFRPVGLDVLAQVIIQLSKTMPLDQAIKTVAKLPRSLNEAPYRGLIWNTRAKTMMKSAPKTTLREVLLYMVGASRKSEQKLLEEYRIKMGDDAVKLPPRVVSTA